MLCYQLISISYKIVQTSILAQNQLFPTLYIQGYFQTFVLVIKTFFVYLRCNQNENGQRKQTGLSPTRDKISIQERVVSSESEMASDTRIRIGENLI